MEDRPSVWRRARAWLRRLLFGALGRPTADPLLDVLPEFDVEALLAELRIRQKAEANGRHEIPATTDTRLDGAEGLIIQRVEQAIREAKSHLETHLSNLTRRIRAVGVESDCKGLEALPASLEHAIEQLLQRHVDGVAPLRESYAALRRELAEFKQRHGVRYEPRMRDSHALDTGVLLAILLGETVLNGVFFAKGDELGLIGGLVNALVVALINIVVCFFLGRCTSWIAGCRRVLRAIGCVAGTVFLCWAGLYNLLVAHARDLLGRSLDYGTVLDRLGDVFQAPFDFTDLNSWLLLGVGVLFSAVAFYEGLRWDDPTLGYSKAVRRVARAREDYLHERDQLAANGEALSRRARDELSQGIERIRYRVEGLRNDVLQKRLLVEKGRNFFRFAVASCNAMLQLYRDLNRQHRKTPPPAHFQQAWSHSEPEIVELDLAPEDERVAAQETLWRQLAARRGELERNIEAIHARFLVRTREMREHEEQPAEGPLV